MTWLDVSLYTIAAATCSTMFPLNSLQALVAASLASLLHEMCNVDGGMGLGNFAHYIVSLYQIGGHLST